MPKVRYIEESGLLIKAVTKIIKNETKEQNRFLSILLGILDDSLLGNILTGKGTVRTGKGITRSGQ